MAITSVHVFMHVVLAPYIRLLPEVVLISLSFSGVTMSQKSGDYLRAVSDQENLALFLYSFFMLLTK